MNNRQEYVYCIFCDTQRTEAVADLINRVLQVHCISPKIVQRYWKKGVCEERIHKYLPGYLFLYADNPVESFRDVLQFPGVLRVLGVRENGYELGGADLAFARVLRDMDGQLGIMKAVKEGDAVRLAGELYHGFTGEIVRLDRRKGRAQIRFDFDGSVQNVWVGYDLIQEKKAEDPHQSE